jgi:hypothetical protein
MQAWPYLMAQSIGYRVVVAGVSGAGYVNPSRQDLGPMSKLAATLPLARLQPSVIIVQAGHDDIGEPLDAISHAVTSLVMSLQNEVPTAKVVLITVFSAGPPGPLAISTDQTIVSAARAADPAVVILDPLTGRWHFPRLADHLHPNPSGEQWLGDHIAEQLVTRGVVPAADLKLSSPPRVVLAGSFRSGRIITGSPSDASPPSLASSAGGQSAGPGRVPHRSAPSGEVSQYRCPPTAPTTAI